MYLHEINKMRLEGKSTIQDLANHLGLDKSSISLALRGSSQVSEQTRRRVQQAAREFGYRPNLAARLLASGTTQAVGLILPGNLQALHHEVVVASIRNLAEMAATAGIIFLIFAGDEFARACRNNMAAVQPDGLLVWGDMPAQVAASMQSPDRPVVVLDPNDLSYASYDGAMVEIDNAGGGRQLVKHLLAQGARRLLFVQADRRHLGHQQRWNGAREAWLEARPLQDVSFCYGDELTDTLLMQFVDQHAPRHSLF